MDVPSIWTEKTQVKTYETDFLGNWKLSSLLGELTEFAAHHAAALGFGYEKMLENEMVWVLSRLKLRFYTLPAFGTQLVVRTWPKGIHQRLFFMRDFALSTPDDRPVVAASFAWLLVNPRLRRILPPQSLNGRVPDNGGLSALPEELEKLSLPAKLEERFEVEARYSTIDLLGHANSARYMDWISDCFSLDDYRARRLDWLQLNFINETRPGERLAISAGPGEDDPSCSFVRGLNLATGLTAFESALGWKK